MLTFTHRRGFTLLELLAVLVLATVLAALTLPAVRSLRSRHALMQDAHQLVSLLATTRAHAMAQRTYAWIGFGEEDGKLLLSIVASKDGTLWFDSDKAGAPLPGEQLVQLNFVRLDHARLALLDPGTGDGHTLETRPEADPDWGRIGANNTVFPFDYPLAGPRRHRFTRTLLFTPRGEVIVNTSYNLRPVVEIGLRATHGGPRNAVAVQITGITGQVNLYK